MHVRKHSALGPLSLSLSLSLIWLGACTPKKTTTSPGANPSAAKDQVTTSDNPLMKPSPLPYQAPEYAKIQPAHILEALDAGIAEQLQEIEAIVANAADPDVENTLEALERSGQILRRTDAVFSSLITTMSDKELQTVEAAYAPKIAAHHDAVYLHQKLFDRVAAIYAKKDTLQGEAKVLAEHMYREFVRAGAKLSADQQTKIRALNAKLAQLGTTYGQNLLASYEQAVVDVKDPAKLAGLDPDEIASLAAAASAAQQPAGTYRIVLRNTTRHPLLSKLENRDLRKQIFLASSQRAAANEAILREIAQLRAEKAGILGYPTWAAYVLEAQMAKTPQAVFKMLKDLAPQSVAKTRAEAKELRKEIKASKQKHDLEPWDWFYYAEKVRQKKYNFDAAQLRPYLELDRVLKDGVFFVMQKLYGITFKQRDDLPKYHPDVRTFEVFDEQGQSIGLFYADYFARKGKQGGAWMMEIVGQNGLLEQKPVVVNCANFTPPAKGEPALINFSDVITMFHEMGHGVHGLLSAAHYPSLAGTNVPRDYVEFPSQFEEDWALDPAVIANYAKHHKTGEVVPKALLDNMKKASSFNKGYESLEYLKSALLDMAWHDIKQGAAPSSVQDFEKAAFKTYGVEEPLVLPRYRSPYFSHVFGGGYAAGYYSYIWTEVLAADAFAYLQTQGGLTRENGERFRKEVLSRGMTVDPQKQYLQFRGQEPKVDALLVRRGLKAQ